MGRSAMYPTGTVVLLLLVWQALVTALKIESFLLPSPLAIAAEIRDQFGLLMQNAAVTLGATLAGFALSILVAVPLSVAIVAWPLLGRAVYPLLIASQTVPKVAIAPLFIVWFGFGVMPKILVAFLIAFFPVVISCVVGLDSVDRDMLQLFRSMGASTAQEFRKLRFPSAVPSIFGGLKVAITFAVVGAVVGEFVGSNSGLGNLLLVGTGQLDTELVFASITVLTAMGVILFYIIELLERWSTRWRPRSPAESVSVVTY